MDKKYKVVVVGMGKRGMHHAATFKANGRFEVAGICDIDPARLDAAAAKLGVAVTSTDARAVAEAVRPDVFCFCTMPTVRAAMIRIGIESGARLIAMEKPVALSSTEGFEVRDLLAASGVKAVVSHQHRYGAHYQAVQQVIASGALGHVHTVYGTATGWMMHMLSHLVEYMRWFNGEAEAEWVMAQAAGRGKLADAHPSPDYIGGFIQFANGVRGVVECGAGAPDVPEVDYWWRKCRIGAQGSEGFAYIQQMADWLDDPKQVHPCNFESAYKGFEITMGLCRSAAGGGQVALPLVSGANELDLLRTSLPDRKVLLSMPANAKEYLS